MAQAEPEPVDYQRQIEQRRRNALGRRDLAVGARQRRHAETGCRQHRLGADFRFDRFAECKHAFAREAGSGDGEEQHRPGPESDAVVERVAEHNDEVEHQRQIQRGNDQARGGETGERNARPAAGDEGHENHARHHPAQRHQPEHVALELVAEPAHAVVDRVAAQPRNMARRGADAIEREIARHHAAIDA